MNALTPGPHSVDIDGVSLSYHVAGSGPVCLVHPGGPGFVWQYLQMPAVEKHLTTVYIEPFGTGESGRLDTHPHGYTRDRYTRAVAGLIDHLGLPKVHLLGHSHGGFVAQHCALHLADRLAGLVLYESAPAVGQEHFAEASRNLTDFVERHAATDVLEAWQSVGGVASDDQFTAVARRLLPAYFADYQGRAEEFADFAAGVAGTFISGLDELGVPTQIDDREVLGSIDVPTLVVVGRHDFICGPRWGTELHERIPGSRLVVLEESGHFGHIEQPDEFARAVADFVLATPA
ncbi:alpha/beta fold hydrolase [Lentzea sp. NPDC051213]|uniref:alpha/beta fold hydrolase n=1 Tax=Lentzea sp. NPDC051213 TaxID=3364126 RepID=UPI0037915B93